MDLSVVIVSWNVKELLRQCLNSLLYAPGWRLISAGGDDDGSRAMEIWVVDNASSDGSPEMVAGGFPGVNLIASDANLGFTRANNLGIERCRGRYVMLLNPDTEVVGGALDALVDYMDANPAVGVVGPKTFHADGSVQSTRRRFPTYATGFVESTILQQWFPHHSLLSRYYVSDRSYDELQDVDWVEGSCLSARAEAVNQVGGLDERFFMYSEELDWCQRMKGAGWRVVYVPDARIIHHGGRSSEQVGSAKHIHFQRSKIAYYSKYFGRVKGQFLRWFLLFTYTWMLVEETVKWMAGHRREMRRERILAYRQVLATRLR